MGVEMKFNVRKYNSNQILTNNICDKYWCEWKNPEEDHVCKKDYTQTPPSCSCEN